MRPPLRRAREDLAATYTVEQVNKQSHQPLYKLILKRPIYVQTDARTIACRGDLSPHQYIASSRLKPRAPYIHAGYIIEEQVER